MKIYDDKLEVQQLGNNIVVYYCNIQEVSEVYGWFDHFSVKLEATEPVNEYMIRDVYDVKISHINKVLKMMIEGKELNNGTIEN